MSASAEVLTTVSDPESAAALLHPLRQAVLREAGEPISAADVARRLGQPRQRVNHHVRALHRAGFLERAGTARRRNMTEQRYRATARSILFSPELLGPAMPDPDAFLDRFSAETLLALATRLVAELARARAEAAEQEKRVATLSIDARLDFESADERAAFASDLERAVLDVVARHAATGRDPETTRPHRLLVGAWPIPPEREGDPR